MDSLRSVAPITAIAVIVSLSLSAYLLIFYILLPKHEETHAALVPFLGDVLNQFFCIMNEAGTDIVVIALEKIITLFEVI